MEKLTSKKNLRIALSSIIGINLLVSLLLVFQGDSGVCLTGQACSIVQSSSYNNLFGIPLAYFAIFSFALLAILLIYENKTKNLLLYVSFLGALFAAYFIYLQAFVIKALCSQCLIIDSLTIIFFIIAIFYTKK